MRTWLIKNRVALLFFALLVLSRVPYLFWSHELVSLNQDYNPTHFGLLFWNDDMPQADDSEVGENARTFSFSTIYYLLPLLTYRLGVPFHLYNVLHILFVMPLFLMGVYSLAYSVRPDRRFAIFAALFVYVFDIVHRFNLGYPVCFDVNIYYGDAFHVPAIFLLVFLLRKQYLTAGICSVLLTLFNPTYGLCGIVLLICDMACWSIFGYREKNMLKGAAFALAGAVISFAMVKLATPIHAPVPVEIRRFCIRSYGHITPHVFNPMAYYKMIAVSLSILALSIGPAINRWYRNQQNRTRHLRQISTGVCLISLLIGYVFIFYFLTYIYWPELLILTSPSKMQFFIAFIIGVYIAFFEYLVVSHTWWGLPTSLLVIFMAAWYRNNFASFAYWGTTMQLIVIWFSVLIGAALVYQKKRTGRWPAASKGIAALPVYMAIVLMAGLAAAITCKSFTRPILDQARDFYEIQLKIKDTLPSDAILTSHHLGRSGEYFGSFNNNPNRTYSRRGHINFWSISRNAYFNSRLRMKIEQRAYQQAGLELWHDVLERESRLRQKDPLRYFTGVSISGHMTIDNGYCGPMQLLMDKVSQLRAYIENLDLNSFLRYAGRLGATHVLISRSPGIEVPGALIETDYFAVVKIQQSQTLDPPSQDN